MVDIGLDLKSIAMNDMLGKEIKDKPSKEEKRVKPAKEVKSVSNSVKEVKKEEKNERIVFKPEATAEVKTEAKPEGKTEEEVENKDITYKRVEAPIRTVEYTPLFDLSDGRIIHPKRVKRNTGVKAVTKTIYLPEEDWQIVENLADKYGVSENMILRTLILNAK